MSTVVVMKKMKIVEMTESQGKCSLLSLSKLYEPLARVLSVSDGPQNPFPRIFNFVH